MRKLNLMNLGELYRELRIARGLKMKDIACSDLSQSQLSKFENGQTMLSADKLLLAISSIHMSFSEFEHAFYQYEDSPFFKQARIISDLHIAKDIAGLKDLFLHYDCDSESYSVYNQLNKLVIKCALYDLDSSYTVSEEEIELLTKYLYGIENWTEYELYIFGNTLHILSDNDLIFLSKSLIERDALYLSIPNNRHRTQLVLINIVFSLLERNQWYYAKLFMNHLDSTLTYQDMFAKTILIFQNMILDYKELKIRKDDIQNYIDKIKEIKQTDVANILQDYINNHPLDE